MGKKINDLSPQELGKLFPIEIVPYNPNWIKLFEKEKEILIQTLGNSVALQIEHFGSTSVPHLASKPTIDILVEIPFLTNELKKCIIEKMKSISYKYIWRTDDKIPYMMFTKGYHITGIKGQTYHIHMGDRNHSLWDRISFRDYLRQNQTICREYENLKYKLATKYKFDRDGYTMAKTDFITNITSLAKINTQKK